MFVRMRMRMRMRMVSRDVVLIVAAAFVPFATASQAIDRKQFDALARQCAPGVHPDTLVAVIQAESSFRPLTININGEQQLPRQPEDIAEAIATATYLSENSYNFDAGLGQINNANVAAFGMTWADVFEPCANLAAAARVLTACFVRANSQEENAQKALRQALSCYNTGSLTRGHRNGYVTRVEHAAGLIPALGPLHNRVDDLLSTDVFKHGHMDAFKRSSIRMRMERELRAGDFHTAIN